MGPLHSPLVKDHAGVLRRVFVAHRRCGVVIGTDLVLLTTPHSYNPSDSHQVAVALQGFDAALLEVHSYALYSNFFQTRWRCPHSLLHFG